MEENNVLILTSYLSAWFWQILSLMFLSFSILLYSIERSTMTIVFFVSFFCLFIIAEFISMRRRKEFEEHNGHS